MPAAPPTSTLLAVPNVSEGRDNVILDAIERGFTLAPARLLDRHADRDHHRAVFTLAGGPSSLAEALLGGAREAVARIDLATPRGVHPHVGALDVVPLVHLGQADRGAACAEALLTGELLGRELELPVFLYGALAQGRTRASLRNGGRAALGERILAGELTPDFGPRRLHPTAGATLVAARPPLVAFNLELAPPADLELARAIAARIREGGAAGLAGLRAIGVPLATWTPPRVQVSMNVEDPEQLPLLAVLEAVLAHADVSAAELVGLAPRAALAGFPLELLAARGFDPTRQIIENALVRAPIVAPD